MSELEIRNIVLMTLKEVKRNPAILLGGETMSQNRASKLVGRGRLEKAVMDGRVSFNKENLEQKNSKVIFKTSEILKLLNPKT